MSIDDKIATVTSRDGSVIHVLRVPRTDAQSAVDASRTLLEVTSALGLHGEDTLTWGRVDVGGAKVHRHYVSPMPLHPGDLFVAVDGQGSKKLFEVSDVEVAFAPRSVFATPIGETGLVVVDRYDKTFRTTPLGEGVTGFDPTSAIVVHDAVFPAGTGYLMLGVDRYMASASEVVAAADTLAVAGLVPSTPTRSVESLEASILKLSEGIEGRLHAATTLTFATPDGRTDDVSYDPPAIVRIHATTRNDLLRDMGEGIYDPIFVAEVVDDGGQTPQGYVTSWCHGPSFLLDGTMRRGDFEIGEDVYPLADSPFAAHDLAKIKETVQSKLDERKVDASSPWSRP